VGSPAAARRALRRKVAPPSWNLATHPRPL